MGIDRIDDDTSYKTNIMNGKKIDKETYERIKLDVMKYHIQYTLRITAEKLAEAGKTIGDLPIPSVEDIGNAAFEELMRASQQTEEVAVADIGFKIWIEYDENDKRDFSRLYRESIIAAASNVKTFTEKFA